MGSDGNPESSMGRKICRSQSLCHHILTISHQYGSIQVKKTSSPMHLVANDTTPQWALTWSETSSSYQDELHSDCHRTV